MGVTLHYRATLRSPNELVHLTAELVDICKSMEWEYQLTNLEMDEGIDPQTIRNIAGPAAKSVQINGLQFTVDSRAEAVELTFDHLGRLLSPTSVLAGDAFPTPDDMFWIHTKTQFAGPDIHALICRLLRYLGDRYFSSIEVLDEANYWDTQNVEELHRAFDQTNAGIARFREATELDTNDTPATVEELAQRIEELFRKIIDRK